MQTQTTTQASAQRSTKPKAAPGKQPMPLTKALHTTRIIERLATVLLSPEGLPDGVRAKNEEQLLAMVLDLIGNTMPTDATLKEQCLQAIRNAVKAST